MCSQRRNACSPLGVMRSSRSRCLALSSWCRVPNCPSQESICQPQCSLSRNRSLDQTFPEQKRRCPWKVRGGSGRAPFSCSPPSWAADGRRQAAAAPKRPPKSWPIRGRLLVPAPPAWTLTSFKGNPFSEARAPGLSEGSASARLLPASGHVSHIAGELGTNQPVSYASLVSCVLLLDRQARK
jgi:hypothetical protein